MVETIVVFVLSLLLVVLIHEAGHFVASKGVGVEVEEFGIGFPPRIIGKKWRGTLYSINAVPIGAFVKSKGENDPSIVGSLASRSPWRRLLVYAAGPGANILLGFVLFTVFFMLPRGIVVSDGVLVYSVQDGSAAQQAGLLPGDIILSADGAELKTSSDLQQVIANVPAADKVALEVQRNDARQSVYVTPFYSEVLGRSVIGITLGRNVVTSIEPGSPGALAGITAGDSVLGVNGVAVVNEADLDEAIAAVPSGQPVVLSLLRQEEAYTAEFTGTHGPVATSLGVHLKWAPLSRIEIRSVKLGTAAMASGQYIVSMPALVVSSMPIIREDPSLAFVGPIGAGQLTVEAVRIFGASNYIFIAGLISIGIALFNLIPMPPLDGGGILVALIEAARRGKRLSERSIRMAYAVGTSLLVTLVILITTSDLLRLIQGRGFGL